VFVTRNQVLDVQSSTFYEAFFDFSDIFLESFISIGEQDSSVDIAAGYRLDGT
jgi:hypothetical protein